jgi:hypothetical protein
MTWIADAGLWATVGITGLVAGLLWPRPHHPSRFALAGKLNLAAAAAVVVAWCATAGQILGGPSSSIWISAYVPLHVAPGFRLAVLWATLPGAALSMATALLVTLALSTDARSGETRRTFRVSVLALIAAGTAAWFAPASGMTSATIPAFVQSAPAALAPLFALVSIAILAWSMTRPPAAGATPGPFTVSWAAATAAIVFEQMARSRLGLGPRDAVVLGSASSGLALWLLTAALMHRKMRSLLFRANHGSVSGRSARPAALTAHVGAACVAFSFGAHALATRSTITLPPGAPVLVTDSYRRPWQFVNEGVSRFDVATADVTGLAVQVSAPGGRVTLLTPQIREQHGPDGQHLSNVISRRESTGGLWLATSVLFTRADSLDVASVRVTFLPVPVLWPVGILLLAISALLAMASPGELRATNGKS